MRNKHSVRILLDPALDHTITDLARRDGRPVANLCVFLLKEALAARRAQQQRPAERNEQQPQS